MTYAQALLILHLHNNPTREEIKKAYRQLCNVYHPDKSTGNKKQFLILKDAYDLVINYKKPTKIHPQTIKAPNFAIVKITKLSNKDVRLVISSLNVKRIELLGGRLNYIYDTPCELNKKKEYTVTLSRTDLKDLNYNLDIVITAIDGRLYERGYKLKKPSFFEGWF